VHTISKKKRGRPSLGGLPSVHHFLSESQRALWAGDDWCKKYQELESNVFATRFNRPRRRWAAPGDNSVAAVNGLDYCVYPSDMPNAGAKDILLDAQKTYKVKVRAYATDRLKIVSFPSAVKPLEKRMSRKQLAAIVRGSNKLGSCFEPRRTYLIGGKRRSIPQFTSWTPNARDWVKDGARCIEKYARGVCFFKTFTIPGRTAQCHQVVSAASGYIVDRLTRWMRDKIVDGLYVLVWEVQDDGTPHLHLMSRLQGDEHIKAMFKAMRFEWHKILLDVSNDSGVNLLTTSPDCDWMVLPKTVNCNYQVVKQNMAGYIAKYMSKAASKSDGSFNFRPGRWYGMSAPLRELVRGRRFDQVYEIAGPEEFAQFIDALSARSFDLFDRLICFPKQEIVRPDVYSFECSPERGLETAIAVAAWILFGDLTELEELESERTKQGFDEKNKQQSAASKASSEFRWAADAGSL
jgi:hypothetical protein